MSEETVSLTELHQITGDIVAKVQYSGRPVVVTRHGQPIVVMVSLVGFDLTEEITFTLPPILMLSTEDD